MVRAGFPYRQLADLKMKLMMNNGQEKGEEMDKEKYKIQYRKLKTKNVLHFRFYSGKNSSTFGKFLILSILTICHWKIKEHRQWCNYDRYQVRSYHLQPFSWFRSTLTRRPSTTSRETRRSRRRPSWVSSEAPWGSSLGSPSSAGSRSSSFSSGWSTSTTSSLAIISL